MKRGRGLNCQIYGVNKSKSKGGGVKFCLSPPLGIEYSLNNMSESTGVHISLELRKTVNLLCIFDYMYRAEKLKSIKTLQLKAQEKIL